MLLDPKPVYSAMHQYLASCGVDGVKVDCQAGVGLVGSALGGGPALSRQFQGALEDSIAQHFDGNHAINCMCHSTENLYRCGTCVLPGHVPPASLGPFSDVPGSCVPRSAAAAAAGPVRMRETAVARASDDFYPRDQASSQPHVAACAYNSVRAWKRRGPRGGEGARPAVWLLRSAEPRPHQRMASRRLLLCRRAQMFLSALVQPDWDMFQSKHPAARLHAIARCGPLVVGGRPAREQPTAPCRVCRWLTKACARAWSSWRAGR